MTTVFGVIEWGDQGPSLIVGSTASEVRHKAVELAVRELLTSDEAAEFLLEFPPPADVSDEVAVWEWFGGACDITGVGLSVFEAGNEKLHDVTSTHGWGGVMVRDVDEASRWDDLLELFSEAEVRTIVGALIATHMGDELAQKIRDMEAEHYDGG